MWINTQSDIISKVLSPAVRLWLKSQVQHTEAMQLHIQGHDRQILRGYIPAVRLGCEKAIYQGLHLGLTQVQAENIRLNIGQILRGKPLKILEPIRLAGEVKIEESDLNNSVSSFILSNAFTDLLIMLLESNGLFDIRQELENYRTNWEKVQLNSEKFTISGNLNDNHDYYFPLKIEARLQLLSENALIIYPQKITGLNHWSKVNLNPFTVDLGEDVNIKNLTLDAGRIDCLGEMVVKP
ncbi:MAG: hypothetical protein N5P05_002984 [Chroococcopsis gigantea SAG 12.99]|jgi:hypothetical protein|nr:DUF2993 domain-containing protein [Chlorogloea purpurea SAG 13.99]MDV3001378.1 hypothetical protein [Chroococcopsis gigantea SAG 12.99]